MLDKSYIPTVRNRFTGKIEDFIVIAIAILENRSMTGQVVAVDGFLFDLGVSSPQLDRAARGEELENADEVLGAVFHGRAGQGPASPPREPADDLAGGAGAVRP